MNGFCKEPSKVFFVLEDLWRDLPFEAFPEWFNSIQRR